MEDLRLVSVVNRDDSVRRAHAMFDPILSLLKGQSKEIGLAGRIDDSRVIARVPHPDRVLIV